MLYNATSYDYMEDFCENAYKPNRTTDSFMPHLWNKAH